MSDWFIHADHKVHGHYPLHCYQDALDSLDSSVEDYTNAKQAISAALAAEALRCRTNCGPTDGNYSPEVSEAVAKMQKAYRMRVTGTLTIPVRRALFMP